MFKLLQIIYKRDNILLKVHPRLILCSLITHLPLNIVHHQYSSPLIVTTLNAHQHQVSCLPLRLWPRLIAVGFSLRPREGDRIFRCSRWRWGGDEQHYQLRLVITCSWRFKMNLHETTYVYSCCIHTHSLHTTSVVSWDFLAGSIRLSSKYTRPAALAYSRRYRNNASNRYLHYYPTIVPPHVRVYFNVLHNKNCLYAHCNKLLGLSSHFRSLYAYSMLTATSYLG